VLWHILRAERVHEVKISIRVSAHPKVNLVHYAERLYRIGRNYLYDEKARNASRAVPSFIRRAFT
jgi:hypothetical protein